MAITLAEIEGLFGRHGHIEYAGEGVTQLQHALQAAQLAEKAGASPELVTAAFLHDLGHLLNLQGDTPSARGIDDQHQYFAIPFLRGLFSAAVIEPISSGRTRSESSAAEPPKSRSTITAVLTAPTTPAVASANSTTSHRVPRRASS